MKPTVSSKTKILVENKICSLANSCSGCSLWQKDYVSQLDDKKQILQQALNLNTDLPVELIEIKPYGFRDYINFTLDSSQGKITTGLYKKQSAKEVLNIDLCLQMSNPLRAAYEKLRTFSFPPSIKGSFKLRTSANDNIKWGLWLDFSNIDIRKILDDHFLMQELTSNYIVEMGQKHKRVHLKNNRWGLLEPELHSWTRTWYKKQSVHLYNSVAGFSQAGDLANQKIIQKLQSWMQEIKPKDFIEYGAGNGNLTIPLLEFCEQGSVYELNPIALRGLEKTLSENNWQNRVRINQGDFYKQKNLTLKSELLVLNPPRSGVGDFIESLTQPSENVFYMSCFLESFVKDTEKLKSQGFELQKLAIVDQFPQTEHFEILSFWSRKN